MPLSRLCFILPADDASADHAIQGQPPVPRRQVTRPRISAAVRRTLHRLCQRRWRGLRRCFPDDDDGSISSGYEDIPGVDQGPINRHGSTNPRIFSYAELYIGTSGFSDKEVLGSGGFGRIYRALLPSDGTLVAVKRVTDPGDRFHKSFAAELVAVAQLRHRNLVRLRGWCIHEHQLLLVYDYMPNRSLDRLLFPAPNYNNTTSSRISPLLPWDRRRHIVTGLAAALFYLHEQLDTQIIHRDVKASNVMLDSNYNARLGDFGLARWLEHSQLELSIRSFSTSNNYQFRVTETSRIGGTIGYLPPESFQKRAAATAKADVFAFGIVVLEVATGRRAVDLAYPDDQIFMLDWVRRLSDEGRLLSAGDQRLPDGSYPLSGMRRLIHLGLLCSLHDPQSRPTMKWVMEALSGDLPGDLPGLPSFQSHPLYISLSSSSNSFSTTTSTTTAGTSSKFLTAGGSTVFLTADDGGGCSSDRSRRKSDSSSSSKGSLTSNFPNIDTPREIPYKEIVAITDNFSESQRVAELDFGTGYHGYLDNRIHVLVKRLGMKTCPALRSRFSDELRNLGRLRHRHLLQLRGWCTEQGEMLVVYDYSSRSLLSHHLFHYRTKVLQWQHRYSIVKSLASAVLYLHEEWEEQVIHRNITSSAVCLDADLSPKLGSFAHAEFLTRNEGHHHHKETSSTARGIFGYMSPEYMESGEATTAADVYSFGVVVLETVSGMMAVDFRRPEVLLVRRVRRARKRAVEELADGRLDGRFDRREMKRLVRVGMACTRSDPQTRPSMRQIVSILDGNDGILETVSRGNSSRTTEDWEERNCAALSLVRRIKALGIN